MTLSIQTSKDKNYLLKNGFFMAQIKYFLLSSPSALIYEKSTDKGTY